MFESKPAWQRAIDVDCERAQLAREGRQHTAAAGARLAGKQVAAHSSGHTARRFLGLDPATGKSVCARMGKHGPFVQLGSAQDSERPRFAGLKPGQRLDTITLTEALGLLHR